jgi:hypothetical protein
MKGRVCAFAAVVAAAALVTAGIATGTPSGKTDAQVIGNVKIDPDDSSVAYVTARYICEGGAGSHTWASVKQAESRLPEQWLTEEGSGAATEAWSHSHRNPVTCDGQWHVGTFVVDQVEWGWGELAQGQAWVQFCIITPNGELFWSMRFAAIK